MDKKTVALIRAYEDAGYHFSVVVVARPPPIPQLSKRVLTANQALSLDHGRDDRHDVYVDSDSVNSAATTHIDYSSSVEISPKMRRTELKPAVSFPKEDEKE